ncbi:MAG: hypothetical protein SOU08_00060 [Anaerococcus sp.]|nr:hypothetical protein [Peptoniphilaceae bacterium]MDY2918032.1 hypothetical protein [Anaerococcus sp.]
MYKIQKAYYTGTNETKVRLTLPDKNLIKAKFDGEKWIEGIDKDEIMLEMLFPENDVGVNTIDFLFLNILNILKKGGMIMDNTWFFK